MANIQRRCTHHIVHTFETITSTYFFKPAQHQRPNLSNWPTHSPSVLFAYTTKKAHLSLAGLSNGCVHDKDDVVWGHGVGNLQHFLKQRVLLLVPTTEVWRKEQCAYQ